MPPDPRTPDPEDYIHEALEDLRHLRPIVVDTLAARVPCHCKRCGYEWFPHNDLPPSNCARCHSGVWNEAPDPRLVAIGRARSPATWSQSAVGKRNARAARLRARRLRRLRELLDQLGGPSALEEIYELNDWIRAKLSTLPTAEKIAARADIMTTLSPVFTEPLPPPSRPPNSVGPTALPPQPNPEPWKGIITPPPGLDKDRQR